MKKIYLLLAAALTVGACSQKEEAVVDSPAGELVNLEVCVPRVSTRATTGNDAAVDRFQVFVFRVDGTLETVSYGSEDSQTVKVSQGAKTIAVLTNHDKLTENLSLDALKNKVVTLDLNTPSAVLMFGTKDVTVSQNATVSVEVTRLVAKIEIAGVKNDIKMDAYKDLPLKLKSVFLINVAGNRTLGGSAPSSPIWYNQLKNDGALPALLCDTPNATVTTAGYSAHHFFYCYPNASPESDSETFTPRPTRLVVELELGTETWFYPVTIPVVEANKHYTIQGLTVTRIGSSTPDDVPEFSNLSFELIVKDWVEVNVDEVTI